MFELFGWVIAIFAMLNALYSWLRKEESDLIEHNASLRMKRIAFNFCKERWYWLA